MFYLHSVFTTGLCCDSMIHLQRPEKVVALTDDLHAFVRPQVRLLLAVFQSEKSTKKILYYKQFHADCRVYVNEAHIMAASCCMLRSISIW